MRKSPTNLLNHWVEKISSYFGLSKENINQKRRADGDRILVRAIVHNILKDKIRRLDFSKYWRIHETTVNHLPEVLESRLLSSPTVKKKVQSIFKEHNLSIKL